MKNRIKEYREKFGLYQSDLAKKLNVDSSTISSWERDRTEPSLTLVTRMCEIFHCSTSDLFGTGTETNSVEAVMESMLDFDNDRLRRLIAYAEKLIQKNNEAGGK